MVAQEKKEKEMARRHQGFYVLGFAAAILLAGILINLVAQQLTTGSIEATPQATTDLEARVAYLEEELAFQSGNIETLELLQWRHEDRVIDVVRNRL
jgi:hypothetical protein